MLPRSARSLLQQAPAYTRTAATTAVKRPAWTPRPRTTTSPAATSSASPAAPTIRKVVAKPAPVAAAGSSTVAPPAVPVAAAKEVPPAPLPIEDEVPAPPSPSSFVRAQPTNPFAPVEGIPASVASTLAAAPESVAGPEVDWSTSYHGLSAQPFTREQGDILMRPLEAPEIQIKPDGLLYLPEILYRRILNKAFGPGGWGMVPRGEMTVMKNLVTREWGLIAGGRLVSVARGEQTFFDPSGVPTATEGCKSNALMRCCKDLGIASELWDPGFIRAFKKQHCVEAWTEHVVSKKKQKRWRKRDNVFEYPYQEATR
ncbi:hypothetical protein JCM10450v2_000325 [Rhodotorula kratochvilovae]